jgi:hypothetical protein
MRDVKELPHVHAYTSFINGAFTILPFTGVSLNLANLSVSAPEHVPIPTTLSSMSTVGIEITHSFVCRRAVEAFTSLVYESHDFLPLGSRCNPYPRAGRNDSNTAATFPHISNQTPYNPPNQRIENISHHDFLLVFAVNSDIFFCTLSLPQ